VELSPVNTIVFGEVVGIHIDERILTNGRIDLTKALPIARLGYMEYTVVREIFEMRRP
jgi:flavin reductase (DIM6/NTAB) family NADH-FMN oxidoreductase RutF